MYACWATLQSRFSSSASIDHQFERKYYARGVGVIKEQALTASKERSELVAVKR
jgi:hypothetical protein